MSALLHSDDDQRPGERSDGQHSAEAPWLLEDREDPRHRCEAEPPPRNSSRTSGKELAADQRRGRDGKQAAIEA